LRYKERNDAQREVCKVDMDLERAQTLKQALLDFVLDAEGDLASALEAFIAKQLAVLSNGLFRESAQTDAAVEMFAMQETVENKPVLEWFLESETPLSDSDRALVRSWRKSFIGLFAVQSLDSLDGGLDLRNWLTAKTYSVEISQPEQDALKRASVGEIILTRILPLSQTQWMLSGPRVLLGKLGKPKLAVAIGNFKTHHKSELYADAPELLEAAWLSVEARHQSFIDFFGGEEVTLPGYQLSQRLTDFQTTTAQSHLKAAGIEANTSLADLADQAGLDPAEIAESMPASISEKMVSQAIEKATSPNMVMPPVEVPAHLKTANSVTVFTHSRWGQVFIAEYEAIKILLEGKPLELTLDDKNSFHQLLKNPEAKSFVWQRLAQKYPEQLELLLRQLLERPSFSIKQDLEQLLEEIHKPLVPELPETASVPQHLHDLFQDAFLEVNQAQSKGRGKGHSSKKSGGFAR
jgi:hypothetical protein